MAITDLNPGPDKNAALTAAQLRAARGLLNLSVVQLAEMTGLAINTIRRAEASKGPVTVNLANAILMKTTLERAGVVFLPADVMGAGVRLATVDQHSDSRRRRDNK